MYISSLTLKLLFLGMLFRSQVVSSQNISNTTNTSNETHKIYYYKFEGQLSNEVKESLANDILKMQFVTQTKIEYKAEKAMGQVRVYTSEKYINNETDFEFSIFGLKQLLIKYQLFPAELRSEVVSK